MLPIVLSIVAFVDWQPQKSPRILYSVLGMKFISDQKQIIGCWNSKFPATCRRLQLWATPPEPRHSKKISICLPAWLKKTIENIWLCGCSKLLQIEVILIKLVAKTRLNSISDNWPKNTNGEVSFSTFTQLNSQYSRKHHNSPN